MSRPRGEKYDAGRAALNEQMLRDAFRALLADAQARTEAGAFGRQRLEVVWENGAVLSVTLDRSDCQLRGKAMPPLWPGVLTRDGQKVE